MPHHMHGDQQMFVQSLNDAIAIETYITECDRRLRSECPPEFRDRMDLFLQQDLTHLENLRNVLGTFGGPEAEPSRFVADFITCCRQMIDSNESFVRKVGVFGLLKGKALADSFFSASVCRAMGDRNCEQMLLFNYGEDQTQQISLSSECVDMIDNMVSGGMGRQAA